MIYFLYGSDTYRSRQKLRDIIAEYRVRYGSDLNLHRFDAEDDDPAALKQIGESSGLFAAKKLIVVEYGLSSDRSFDALAALAAHSARDPDTLVVLWDRELDAAGKQRLIEIQKNFTKIQKFVPLTGAQRERWIREEAGRRKADLSPSEVRALAASGGDSWGIAQAIEKSALGTRIAAAGPAGTNVFALGDAFFTSRRDGLRRLLEFLHDGQDEFGLFSYLANHSRTLALVKHYSDQKKPVPPSHGIHPFVAKKSAALVRGIETGRLIGFLHDFFEEDWRIKTGLSNPQQSLLNILSG